MDETDKCGYIKEDDEPCQLPGSRDDGRCHHHTDDTVTDGGRPSKFNEERKQRLLEAAEAGMTIDGCARSAGIGVSTLYDWFDKYPDFSEAFNRARAKGEMELVEEVSQRNPQFILERSYDYVKTERREIEAEHEHSGDVDHTINHELSEDDREFIESLK